jgi:TetR/AcrR family transcriptional regulator, fatty acid metabolism regulator protein
MTTEITNRQLEIIEAAGKILTELGINGLTTKNIAAKMDFGESALYRHFPSKEEIIRTMLQYLKQNMDERLTACIAHINAPDEQLIAVFNNQFDYFKDNPHFLVAIFSEGLLEKNEAINKTIMDIMSVKKGHLFKIVVLGQEKKVFNTQLPPEDLVHIIMGAFRLQMLQWRMSGFTFDLKIKGNKLIQSLLTLIVSKV